MSKFLSFRKFKNFHSKFKFPFEFIHFSSQKFQKNTFSFWVFGPTSIAGPPMFSFFFLGSSRPTRPFCQNWPNQPLLPPLAPKQGTPPPPALHCILAPLQLRPTMETLPLAPHRIPRPFPPSPSSFRRVNRHLRGAISSPLKTVIPPS
jgi:hypothetical protein